MQSVSVAGRIWISSDTPRTGTLQTRLVNAVKKLCNEAYWIVSEDITTSYLRGLGQSYPWLMPQFPFCKMRMWGYSDMHQCFKSLCTKGWGLPQWLRGKESACNTGDTEDSGYIPGLGRSPVGGNWRISCLGIPWTEEPGVLQSTVSRRVGYDWAPDGWTH